MSRPTEAELAEIVKRSGARMVKRHDLDRGPNVLREALPMAKPQKVKPARRRPHELSEHAEQALVIQWFDWWAPSKGLDPRLLVAVPNAQKFMSSARNIHAAYASAKAEGLRKGYPDLILDLPHPAFHGMRIEVKAKDGKVKDEQREYHNLLRRNDYNVLTCFGADEATRAITVYCESALAAAR